MRVAFRLGVLAIAATAMLALAVPRAALAVDRFQVGEWRGQSRFDEKNGKFSRCTIEGQYRSGITLFFGITRDYRLEIWLSNDSWRLDQGSSYNVQYRIDNGPRYGGTVSALTSTLARLDVTDDEDDVYDQLRQGARLMVSGAGEPLSFRLDGTAVALDRLRQCVEGELRAETTKGNPFGPADNPGARQGANPLGRGQQSGAQPPIGGQGFGAIPSDRGGAGQGGDRRGPPASATKMIEYIFGQPQFADYKLLRGRERPADMQEFDEVWRAPNQTIGTIKSYASARTVEQIIRDIASDDRRSCQGQFVNAADAASLPNGGTVSRLAVACRGDEKSWFAAYSAYPVRDGGTYVVAHISFGTGLGASRADDQVLEAVRADMR